MNRISQFSKKLLPSNDLLRGTAILSLGNIGAQATLLLSTPILTRLYDPSAFGEFSLFNSLVTVLVCLVCGRLDWAIMLPESDAEAIVVGRSGIWFLFVTIPLVCISLLFLMSTEILSGVLNYQLVTLICIALILGGALSIFRQISIRHSLYNSLAFIRIASTSGRAGLQLMLFPFGPYGLIISYIIANTYMLVYLRIKTNFSLIDKSTDYDEVSRVVRKYKKFPLITTWASLLNTAGTHLPALLYAPLFSIEKLGLYALAERIIVVPSSIIVNALSGIFYKGAVAAFREGRLANLVEKTYDLSCKICMAPLLCAALLAPWVFGVIFGDAWVEAGELAQLVCINVFFYFSTSPLSHVLRTIGRQEIEFWIQVLSLSLRASFILLFATTGEFYLAVVGYTLATVLYYMTMLFIVSALSKANGLRMFISFLKNSFVSVLLCLPILIHSLHNLNIVISAMLSFIALGIYEFRVYKVLILRKF